MTRARRVALVTGAYRGIGLETCRQLCARGLAVVLTARDAARGEAAARALADAGGEVVCHPLDVTDPASAAAAARFADDRFGRLDVLVNNAGVMLDSSKRGASVFEATGEVMRASLETHLLGALWVSQAMVPLMRRGGYGRVVNLSSALGQLETMEGRWPGYRISKSALNALTVVMADELRDTGILVNSCCPGWVRTDIGGPKAPRTVEEGADTVVWLATLPDDGPTGRFFRDREPIPW